MNAEKLAKIRQLVDQVADGLAAATTFHAAAHKAAIDGEAQDDRARIAFLALKEMGVDLGPLVDLSTRDMRNTIRPGRTERDVLAECVRQRAKYDDRHNDLLLDQSLASAAAVLAIPSIGVYASGQINGPGWAYSLRAKHNERRQQLVIAAALILAEIDRLDRGAPK